MARHGENIRKRHDGRWEARYQVRDGEDGRKICRSVYGRTYEEAKKKRADAVWTMESRAEQGTGQQAGQKSEYTPGYRMEGGGDGRGSSDGGRLCPRVLFSQAAAEWLEEVADKRKHSTYVKYGNVYRLHIEGVLGSLPLSGTPDRGIQEKISDHLSGGKLSESLQKSIRSVSRQILEFAGRKYDVRVPALNLSAVKTGKKQVEAFSKAEQSRLLECIRREPDRFKAAMLLCLYTGLRLGELCALKWTDFDFEDRTVTVNRTVQRIAVKGYMTRTVLMETDPKSESSKRTIPLTDETVRLLEGLAGEGDYVFGGGRPLEPRTMQYRLKKILKEAGVDGRNFHILRHTFATNCVESGIDVKTLSVILGHSDVRITLNRYVHPTMDSRRRQMGRLSDFYGQICGQAA